MTNSDTWNPNAHEFEEDVDDASMCVCGIPGLTHDAVMAQFAAPAGLPLHESADRDADNVPSDVLRRAVLLWAERFQPGDRWDPEDLWDLRAALAGTVEAHPTAHHRRQADNVPSDRVRMDRVGKYAEVLDEWLPKYLRKIWTEPGEARDVIEAIEVLIEQGLAGACVAVEERRTAALRDRLARVEALAAAQGAWRGEKHVRIEERRNGYTVTRSAVWVDDLNAALCGPEPTEDGA